MRLRRFVIVVAVVLIASAAVAEQLPGGSPSGRGNVTCSPNPLILAVANPDGTVSVEYGGGGSGLLYSYSMKFTWDGTYAHTSADSVSEGDLLSDGPNATFFNARRTGDHEVTVDGGRLGQVDGASGPGTLFTIDFSAVADGSSSIDITIIHTRDRDNNDLTGFSEDDGSVQVDLTAPDVPAMTAELTYTQGTANTVTWSDESGTGAAEYSAERATDSGFTADVVSSGWVSGLSHEFTGLTDAQIYYYRVKARDAALNESGWSNTESSTQDDTAPATSAGDPGATQNSFPFDVPYNASDATSGVQYVELWYQVGGGGYVQFPGTFTTSPISFTSAAGDGVYDFYTIGTDDVGNVEGIPGSPPDASTTVDTTAPDVPTMTAELTYTQGTANTVVWSDESASGADEYYAERATDVGFTADLASSGWGAVLSYEFTGLTDGDLYYYRVKARDTALNESGWSNTESSTQDDTAPATAALDPGATQTSLTFDVPYSASDATSGVDYVELWYQVDGGGYLQFGTTFATSPISFTAPADGAYDFYTIGTDNVGNVEGIPGSPPDASTTVDTGPPDVPAMTGEPTYTQGTANTVAWSDESGTGAAEYSAERADDAGFTTGVVSSGWVSGLSHEFTGLTDAQIYYYRVKARDTALNESGWSNTESSTQDDTAPATSAGDPGATQNSFPFDVPYSASDATSGVQYVELWYQVDEGGYDQYGSTFTGSPISFTATVDGVYDFYTIGTDNVGNVEGIPGSPPDASTTVDTGAPDVPTMTAELTYTAGTSNTVSWSDESVSGADEYYAERATDTDFTTDVFSDGWASGTSHEFTGLTDGDTYYYRVKARDTALNESGWSNTESSTQDDTAPATSAGDPGATQNSFPFDVPYTASDATSGVDFVELWYQVDGGGYLNYGISYTTPIWFSSGIDGVFDFYTIGWDNVGNHEVAPGSPDASTTVDTTPPTVTPVAIENLTLPDTDEYAKDTDDLELTATVTDNISTLFASDITADFSALLVGGGSAVVAEDYTGTTATWTVELENVTLAADGLKTVTVSAEDGVGHIGTGNDQITVDNTAPTAITGFSAAPAHEEVDLSWDDPTGLDTNYRGVVVQYVAWGDYPYYVTGEPTYPAAYEVAGLEAFDGTGLVATHSITDRAIYYYSAFVYDEALNYGGSDSGGQDRSTNYWLGDVAKDTLGVWGHNGLVDVFDIDKLGGNYGLAPPPVVPGYPECDVGPTDDHSRFGIPLPDDIVQFEDLMIFAMNYGAVSARVVPFLPLPEVTKELALSVEERSTAAAGEVELSLVLSGNVGELKGLSGVLTYDTSELGFVSARLSSEMSSPLGDVFFWHGCEDGRIQLDLVVLGTDVTAGGSGEVAVLTFTVLSDDYTVEIESADLRGSENLPLDADLEGFESSPEFPMAFRFVQNVPNPFNPVTQIAYHVPCESAVSIRIYDVSGRLVRTLVDRVSEPGRHVAVWDGSTDSGASVGSGVYFCTMEAPDFHESRKMMLLK